MEKQRRQKAQNKNQRQDPSRGDVTKRDNKQPVPQPKDYEDIEY